MKKGEYQEAKISENYHTKYPAVLISPVLLRSMDMGQVDVAYLKKIKSEQILYLLEVKSGSLIAKKQRIRLLKTQDYLSKVLNIKTILKLKFCQKADQTLFF